MKKLYKVECWLADRLLFTNEFKSYQKAKSNIQSLKNHKSYLLRMCDYYLLPYIIKPI